MKIVIIFYCSMWLVMILFTLNMSNKYLLFLKNKVNGFIILKIQIYRSKGLNKLVIKSKYGYKEFLYFLHSFFFFVCVKMLKQNTSSFSSFLLCYFVKRLEKGINRCKCIFLVIFFRTWPCINFIKKKTLMNTNFILKEKEFCRPTNKLIATIERRPSAQTSRVGPPSAQINR